MPHHVLPLEGILAVLAAVAAYAQGVRQPGSALADVSNAAHSTLLVENVCTLKDALCSFEQVLPAISGADISGAPAHCPAPVLPFVEQRV